jgi:peptide/nickel transport system substrate-binding protein
MVRCRTFASVSAIVLAALLMSCAPGAPEAAGGLRQNQPESQPGRKKVLNMGLRTIIDAFSIAGSSTTSGGGLSYIEIHSQALFTSDKTTGRPIPRLLADHPTIDNGGLRVTDDGRMVSTYRLRPDVKWADGAPVTTKDMLFTYRVIQNPNMPIIDRGPASLMDSIAAQDDQTFTINWKQPYYLADALGLRVFWPLPAHLLEADYESMVEAQSDSLGFLSRPYWTSEYVHIGPFKLAEFTPGVSAAFDAVDDYFLGRPRVDRIVVTQFADPSTLLANVLSGAIDLGPDGVMEVEQAVELKGRWDRDGGGKIYFGTGTTQFVSVQFDASVPDYQSVIADKRVREALYQAIDRDAYADVASAGIPDKGAYALLPPDNPLYSYVRDGWKQRYPYDVNRAAAIFEDAGWRRGADGLLANAAGQHLRLETRNTAGMDQRSAVIADMWRRAGVEAEIFIVPATRVRDTEFRQQFPGIEITARGSQDSILTRLECGEQPSPQNRFSGNNRGHWCNQDYEKLVSGYRGSLREAGQGQAIKSIQDLVLDELPIMLLNYQVAVVFARKGVTAFQDDFAGGSEAGRIYGTYGRNAHEWDVS